ncbi:MAG: nucleoside 2-deoxyribosyltransferase [Methylobacteriaceae bacterium]|nr:nucleoside 2-deoxyribosyltransferase [Rhodoblastus sp.]MCC0004188.1 nucleoside 2-deoxyribosyltransferase [Methylobacteriaceae bacterium]
MATTVKRIYLAGPLGFSELGRRGQGALVALVRDLGHDVLDPFALAPQDEIEHIAGLGSLDAQREAWRDLNRRIGETNAHAIDSCDLVLAVLDGADVDSGTAAEIGYAFARGKRILGYRGDFRLAADNVGSIVNLQVEYFITAGGGEIVTTLAALRDRLAAA